MQRALVYNLLNWEVDLFLAYLKLVNLQQFIPMLLVLMDLLNERHLFYSLIFIPSHIYEP